MFEEFYMNLKNEKVFIHSECGMSFQFIDNSILPDYYKNVINKLRTINSNITIFGFCVSSLDELSSKSKILFMYKNVLYLNMDQHTLKNKISKTTDLKFVVPYNNDNYFYYITQKVKKFGACIFENEKKSDGANTIIKYKCHDGHITNKTIKAIHNNPDKCMMCAGIPPLTQENASSVVAEKCKEKNLEFTPFTYINISTKINLYCKIHDYSWVSVYNNIRNDGFGCKYCASAKNSMLRKPKNPQQEIEKICVENGYKLVEPFVYTNQTTVIHLMCDKHPIPHTWKTAYASLVYSKTKCNLCQTHKSSRANIINKEERKAQVQAKSLKNDWVLKDFEFGGSVCRNIHLECHKHSRVHKWTTTYHHYIVRDQGCAACNNGHTQQYAYINTILDNDLPVALKYGIEKQKGTRVKTQNRKSLFKVQSLYVYVFQSVEQCKNAEKECKKIFGKGILSKREMCDGYTETTTILNLGKIIEIYEKWGGVKQ
ncbi:TPA: hypothetical protein ACQFCQ_001126 [Escherichia coli]